MNGAKSKLIFSLLTLVMLTSLQSESNPLKKHPAQNSVLISNGNTVSLPVHYTNSWGLVVQGTVLKSVAENIVSRNNQSLSKKHIKGDRYTVVYYFVEHKNSTITSRNNPSGKYGEFFTAIPVHPHPQRKSGYLVEQMIVSDRDALLAGREIWGINKSKATFSPQWDQKLGGGFRISGEGCHMNLKVQNKAHRFKLGIPPLFPIPFGVKVPLISSYELRRQAWTDTLLHGRPRFAPWNPKYDSLEATRGHCSRLFKEWDFQAKHVIYYKNAKALLFHGLKL